MDNIKYCWKIENLLKKNTDNLENVIYNITWNRCAVDLTNNIATSLCSSLVLEIPTNYEGFIPYEQLKEEDVINWLNENINLEKLDEKLEDQIQYNRSLVHPPNFPWN
jgi:hypothetical protein